MISRQQWAKITKVLSWAHGSVELLCDGYHLDLTVVPFKPLAYVIMPRVNGKIEVSWLSDDCEERRRFLRPSQVYVYPEKLRRDLLRIEGRRISSARRAEINRKVTVYDWAWLSPLALRRHLLANNRDISVVNACEDRVLAVALESFLGTQAAFALQSPFSGSPDGDRP